MAKPGKHPSYLARCHPQARGTISYRSSTEEEVIRGPPFQSKQTIVKLEGFLRVISPIPRED